MWKRMIVMAICSAFLVACSTGTPDENPVEAPEKEEHKEQDDVRIDEETPDRQDDGVIEEDESPFEDDGTLNRDPLKDDEKDEE